jgi:hypothetical protein
MISRQHRCIFVHIPRTGGTSLEEVIWGWPRTPDQLWMGFIDEFHNKYQTGGLQHLLASQIRLEVGPDIFGSYFKFAFVRNPFDRLVSQYHFMRRRPDLRQLIGLADDAPFAAYVSRIQKVAHVQWEEQNRFVYNDQGDLLVDVIGRFESYEQDAQKVLSRLGLQSGSVPHLNKTPHRPYQEYYDDATRAAVASMFQKDLSLFGYSFA